jgi:N6-adenosine-specific RNA methylase IME4
MSFEQMKALPIGELCLPDAVGIFWTTGPHLGQMMELLPAYGFTYKTIGFGWMKADVATLDMFSAPKDADIKMGYWTRSNLEIALLATKGKPKRVDAGVRMGIIEPARQHSRKPDVVHERIERLVSGPYVELFARTRRKNWLSWGNDLGKFKHAEEA